MPQSTTTMLELQDPRSDAPHSGEPLDMSNMAAFLPSSPGHSSGYPQFQGHYDDNGMHSKMFYMPPGLQYNAVQGSQGLGPMLGMHQSFGNDRMQFQRSRLNSGPYLSIDPRYLAQNGMPTRYPMEQSELVWRRSVLPIVDSTHSTGLS